MSEGRTRVVVVGGGFAGYNAARALRRALPRSADVEIVLVNRTDYFLYLPLLPEVAAAVIDPRRVTVSIPATLRGVRLALGDVTAIDPDRNRVEYTDPEGGTHTLGYDRLILAAGSVTRLLPVPGVVEHAHGFRGVAEALYLRDHVIRQVELAAASDDPAERDARCTFVVVGAGYTGTEVAAQGPLLTEALRRRHPVLADQRMRWMLLDLAPKVLPSSTRGCPAPPPGCSGLGTSRCSPAPPWRRRCPTACGSPRARPSRPAPWSGASASGRTRW